MLIDSLNQKLIGLILLCSMASIYGYYNYNIVELENMNHLRGTLKDEPYEGSHGGDITYEYIRFRLNEYPNKFYIKSCAYDDLKLRDFLNLSKGDSLVIGVVDRLSDSNNNINVYSIYSDRFGSLLKIENYNECNRNEWKYSFYCIFIIFIILVFRIGRRLFRNWRSQSR